MRRFGAIAVLLRQTSADTPIVKRAIALAKNNGASLSIYSTFEEPAYVTEMHLVGQSRRRMVSQVKISAQRHLKSVIGMHLKEWAAIRGKLLVGKPFIEAIREVIRNGHDMLMVSAEEQGKHGRAFMGGTVMHLLRKCPCAVWVFRPRKQQKFRRIMATINVATKRREEIEMNVQILEMATSLAQQEGAELHIVHCWSVSEEFVWAGTGKLLDEERRCYLREVKKNRVALLQTYLKRLDIDKATTRNHVLKGEAADLIGRLTERLHVDLIVMGTVARTGISGFFIGNTAEKVLNTVSCSVLTVKPAGFVSPVTLETRKKSTT